MAHSLSAFKRQRQSLVRRTRNQGRRTAARSAVRRARELIEAGEKEDAATAVRTASSLLDRAARKGTIHPNNAARRKSRLEHALKAAGEGVEKSAAKPRASRSKASGSKTRSSRAKKS